MPVRYPARIFFLFLVSALLLFTSCTPGDDNPEYTDFYQGSEGITMRFSDNTPPYRMYYHSLGEDYTGGTFSDYEANAFDVNVIMKNEGASFAFGTLFFSGYNPNMVFIPPYDPTEHIFDYPYHRCSPRYGNAGGDWTILLDCSLWGGNVNIGGGGGNTGGGGWIDVNAGWVLDKAGIDWFKDSNLRVGGDLGCPDGDKCTYSLAIDYASLDHEDIYNGKLAYLFYTDYYSRTYGLEAFPNNPAGYPFFLAGDNYYYPGGEQTFIDAPSVVQSFPAGLDQSDQPIVATACYIYTTHATPEVCIDRFPHNGAQKVCYPGVVSMKGTQGAPIAITRVTQENTPRKIIFQIDVSNVGRGQVYDPAAIHKCNPWYPERTTTRDKDVVHLLWISLGTQGFENMHCSPDEYVRLTNGKGTIICEYTIPPNTPSTAYKDNLVIELAYGYEQHIQKSIQIKRVK